MEWEQFLFLVDRLKRAADYKMLLLISIGCYAGLRLSDILSIKWEDIINRDSFEIQERKTGKYRKITINSNLGEIISFCRMKYTEQNTVEPSGHLFINRRGLIVSKQYINRSLHTIFKVHKIRVQNGSSHTLRKTFGRRVYELNNCSESALILLSSIFNHNSVSITRRYIGLSQEQIKDVYLNL